MPILLGGEATYDALQSYQNSEHMEGILSWEKFSNARELLQLFFYLHTSYDDKIVYLKLLCSIVVRVLAWAEENVTIRLD